jgi:hypothetical protein
MRAWERADVDAVVAVLAEDAVLAMPPLPTCSEAATRSRPSSRLGALGHRAEAPRRDPCERPAGLRQLHLGPRPEALLANDIVVLTMDGASIAEITAFLTQDIFERFGLPAEIARDRA